MTSNESDSSQSVLEMELETLRSIYVNELNVKYNENDVPCSVSILLHPATADKLEEQYVRMNLEFQLSEEYPSEIPEIIIQNTRGLSDAKIEEIFQNLMIVAEKRIGSFMLFELIESAKEQLTAGNKPNEECAICLYGFLEGDRFMKTDCYHYFHCHCLSRYLEHRLMTIEQGTSEKRESDKDDSSGKNVPCPVCRAAVWFPEFGQKFPEPIGMAEAAIVTESPAKDRQKEFDDIYQKQLARGGIIDVEAENNKFLLEISAVRNKTTTEVTNKTAEHSENDVTEPEMVVKKRTSVEESKNAVVPKTKSSPTKPREEYKDTSFSNSVGGEERNRGQFNRNMRSNGYNKLPYYNSGRPSSDKTGHYEDSSYKGEFKSFPNADTDRKFVKNRREKFRSYNQAHENIPQSASDHDRSSNFDGRSNTNWNRYDSRKNNDRSYSNRPFQNRFNRGPRMSRDNGYHRAQNPNSFRKEENSRYPSTYQEKNVNRDENSSPENDRGKREDIDTRKVELKKNFEGAKGDRRPKTYFREKNNSRFNRYREERNIDSRVPTSSDVPENAAENSKPFNKPRKEYFQPRDYSMKYHYPDNRRKNYTPGRYYNNSDSRNRRNDYEKEPAVKTANERNQSPPYSSSYNSYNRPLSKNTYNKGYDTPKNYNKIPSPSDRHKNNGFSERHPRNETNISGQEKKGSESSPQVEHVSEVKPIAHAETKTETVLPNSLSNSIPSLPPGFANPSKKVIYGLPPFNPPPGFNLS